LVAVVAVIGGGGGEGQRVLGVVQRAEAGRGLAATASAPAQHADHRAELCLLLFLPLLLFVAACYVALVAPQLAAACRTDGLLLVVVVAAAGGV
jgi:hypothetical protein